MHAILAHRQHPVCLPLQANASALVGNRLSLLLDDDLDGVQAAADKLKVLLPNITVDKFVEYYPQVLDIDDFELALQVIVTRGSSHGLHHSCCTSLGRTCWCSRNDGRVVCGWGPAVLVGVLWACMLYHVLRTTYPSQAYSLQVFRPST